MKLYRTNLTEDTAYLHERFLIRTFRAQGIFLLNFDNGGRRWQNSKKQRKLFEKAQVERLNVYFNIQATCLVLNVPVLCEEEALRLGAFQTFISKTWYFPKTKSMPEELKRWL